MIDLIHIQPILSWLPISLSQLIFYGFVILAIFSAAMVVFAKNSVRAVLFLILCFFATGGIWVLLEAEFLAMTLVLVYVGAVMVLFLFVVMMLDIEIATVKAGFARFLPLGLLVSLLVIAALVYAIRPHAVAIEQLPELIPRAKDYSQVQILGVQLYTQYLYPFEIAGVLLLVAIVSAISLTFRGKRHSNKAIESSDQVQVLKSERLRILNMPAEEKIEYRGVEET